MNLNVNYAIKFMKIKIKKGTSLIHFTLVIQGEWLLIQIPEGCGISGGKGMGCELETGENTVSLRSSLLWGGLGCVEQGSGSWWGVEVEPAKTTGSSTRLFIKVMPSSINRYPGNGN